MRVIEPGLLTTVQDLGRPGFGSIGVPTGGAADAVALRIGNRLLGNPDSAPALEMTLTGSSIMFEHDTVVALTGGAAAPLVQDSRGARPVPMASPFPIRAGESLLIGPVTRGARTYLCLRGGVAVPLVLESASTHLGAAFGGSYGRALQRGDTVAWHDARPGPPRITSAAAARLLNHAIDSKTLRATDGAHTEVFDSTGAGAFWSSEFAVSSSSDRMGVRLRGSIASTAMAAQMRSEGMMCGAVQVPPGGEPIVLMVDHPTTGGYPVIACIATVDLPVLGQLRPGDHVRFERVSPNNALELFRQRESELAAQEARP